MEVHRDQSLDTLRGAAIGLVIVGHYLAFAPFKLAGLPLGRIVQDFGRAGVLLFFILSGYLIYETAQNRPWTVFLVKRFAKIVPAYWTNVILVFLAGTMLNGFPRFSALDTTANLLFLGGNYGFSALSGVYWTLIIEVKFYLLFALIFYTRARSLLLLVPAGTVLANLLIIEHTGQSSAVLT